MKLTSLPFKRLLIVIIIFIIIASILIVLFKHSKKRLEEKAWTNVLKGPNEAAFQEYLNKFPEGKNKNLATERLYQMRSFKDNTVFEIAIIKNTIQAYEDYLKKYPNGINAKKAREKLTLLKSKE